MSNGLEDYKTFRKLKLIQDMLAEACEPDMPLSYMRVMTELFLAHLEGGGSRSEMTQKELIERMGNPNQSNVSKAVQALSSKRRGEVATPYELVESFPHIQDRRMRVLRLNQRGKALLHNMLLVLNSDKPVHRYGEATKAA